MADLKREYTDVKGVKHPVEHRTVPERENTGREQLLRELANLLAKPGRRS